jgi:hypothetical protein
MAPDASISLEHVFGYRCHDTRNNLRYIPDSNDIVYHSAAIVVIMDKTTRT